MLQAQNPDRRSWLHRSWLPTAPRCPGATDQEHHRLAAPISARGLGAVSIRSRVTCTPRLAGTGEALRDSIVCPPISFAPCSSRTDRMPPRVCASSSRCSNVETISVIVVMALETWAPQAQRSEQACRAVRRPLSQGHSPGPESRPCSAEGLDTAYREGQRLRTVLLAHLFQSSGRGWAGNSGATDGRWSRIGHGCRWQKAVYEGAIDVLL